MNSVIEQTDKFLEPDPETNQRNESNCENSDKSIIDGFQPIFVKECKNVLYSVDEIPPWDVTILVGFQHYLSMFCATIFIPFLLSPALCIEDDDPARSQLVSTIIFVSGLITLLQSTLGVRLPILQGGAFAFVVPTFAILNLPEWECPKKEDMLNMTYEDKTELWQLRMREVQGAIMVASSLEILIGAFGIIGCMSKFITPLTIAPTITMLGISLFSTAGKMAGSHWGISGASIVLVIIFSQYLSNVSIPIPAVQCAKNSSNGGRCKVIKPTFKRFKLFQILPFLLTVALMWILCYALTMFDVFEPGSAARTGSLVEIVESTPWFSIPYPGQWGFPTASATAGIGILAGTLSSIIESIGDYYACARLCGERPPPSHAINRGILVEGIGCFLAGLWGSGNGTTSYSGNIGDIGITKVASRRVIQAAGVMMLFFGIFSKLSAIFITIPEPIIGGMFCIAFSMVTATGISNLQLVDLNSTRNIFVLGFSTFFPLVISQWITSHPGVIQTGFSTVDQVSTVLLSTTMFLAGVIGCILDNTIPGKSDERGLISRLNYVKQQQDEEGFGIPDKGDDSSTYDLPFITPWLKKQSWATYLPFLPSHKQRKRFCPAFCCKN